MPAPILPNLPKLAPESKQVLIARCNEYPRLDAMLHYLQTGEITFEDMPSLNAERKELLMKQYNEWKSMPEPVAPHTI